MPIETDWFRKKLAERSMSQRGLARQMGLDAAAVSLMLRGRREMKLTEAASIAALIGVPAEEVLAHAGVKISSNGRDVPIVGTIDGIYEVKWGESKELGTVPRPSADLPAGVHALQCRTAGTQLDYMDRCVLFIEPPRTGVIDPESVGKLAVVKLRNGVTGVAHVSRSYTARRWRLSGPIGTVDNAELEYATPVLLITT